MESDDPFSSYSEWMGYQHFQDELFDDDWSQQSSSQSGSQPSRRTFSQSSQASRTERSHSLPNELSGSQRQRHQSVPVFEYTNYYLLDQPPSYHYRGIFYTLIKWFIILCLLLFIAFTMTLIWVAWKVDNCPARTSTSHNVNSDGGPFQQFMTTAAPTSSTEHLYGDPSMEPAADAPKNTQIVLYSDPNTITRVSTQIILWIQRNLEWTRYWISTAFEWMKEKCDISRAFTKLYELGRSISSFYWSK